MERIPVKSSNIAAIGWQPETETLEVEFLSKKEGVPGAVHQYEAVDYDDYHQFLNAKSVGTHFHEFIKHKYSSHRVDADPVKKEENHGEGKESTKETKKRIS